MALYRFIGGSSRGFTLVEMIVVLVIIGAVFGIGAMGLGRAFYSYDLARTTTDIDWQGRVALERMAREMRDIRSATATDLSFTAASPETSIRFLDADGNAACFVLSGGSLQRGVDGPSAASCATSLQPLADNVTSLGFYYVDAGSGANTAATAAAVTAVDYIVITFQVTRGGITETFRTTVQPRRL